MRFITVSILASVTWVASLLHVTAQPPPTLPALNTQARLPASMFLERSEHGVHHLVLHGSPYFRGRAEGSLTKSILAREERVLFQEFERFFPSPFFRALFLVGAMRYFWGVEKYFSDPVMEYLYGLAPAASPSYNHYIDPFTRQAVLHGIHEVGQLFVDIHRDDLGCTALVVPNGDSWLIGRNFDFEVGRLFDEEKTLKWHFPDVGNNYLSISWPGFLGTVTGVNEHGLYISLNAAGSSDFRRYGQPTTLLATEILQFSSNIDEAIIRLKEAETFIADIFLIADRHRAVRVEKTPQRNKIIPIDGPHAVTNHLIHPDFSKDPVNKWRIDQLTTKFRSDRAYELLKQFGSKEMTTERQKEIMMLKFLRDKKAAGGESLHLGNRRAIDALIASHSVIYNAKAGRIYVSEGPALTGPYRGYDLTASFAKQIPSPLSKLPADNELSPEDFRRIKSALKEVARAETLIKDKQCHLARKPLEESSDVMRTHNYFHRVYGNYYSCLNDMARAKSHWQQALLLKPAYMQDRNFLKERL